MAAAHEGSAAALCHQKSHWVRTRHSSSVRLERERGWTQTPFIPQRGCHLASMHDPQEQPWPLDRDKLPWREGRGGCLYWDTRRQSWEAGRKQELTCCPGGTSCFQMFMCSEFLKTCPSRQQIVHSEGDHSSVEGSVVTVHFSDCSWAFFFLTKSNLHSELSARTLFHKCPYLLDDTFACVRTFCHEFVMRTVHCGLFFFCIHICKELMN